jgi:hypothetical protein
MNELAIYEYSVFFFNERNHRTYAKGQVIAEDEEHAIDTLEDWYYDYTIIDIKVEFAGTFELVTEYSREAE